MTDFVKLAPIVEKAYHEFEAQTAQKQKAFEDQYLKTYKKDAKKADKMGSVRKSVSEGPLV